MDVLYSWLVQVGLSDKLERLAVVVWTSGSTDQGSQSGGFRGGPIGLRSRLGHVTGLSLEPDQLKDDSRIRNRLSVKHQASSVKWGGLQAHTSIFGLEIHSEHSHSTQRCFRLCGSRPMSLRNLVD
jgi:hypothetical protein